MLRTRQSMTAAAITAIPMQAQRATQAVLVLHNVALTTAQARPLPALAADLAHLRIPARHPAPVRLLDQVPPALPLLRVRTLRTQATTHRPDQVTVRRLHLRQRHLRGSRIPVEAVVRHSK
jgi:hypothetical protein